MIIVILVRSWQERSYKTARNGNTLALRWVPGHSDIEGSDIDDKQAKNVSQNQAAAVAHKPNI
jgi:hypothetical protein